MSVVAYVLWGNTDWKMSLVYVTQINNKYLHKSKNSSSLNILDSYSSGEPLCISARRYCSLTGSPSRSTRPRSSVPSKQFPTILFNTCKVTFALIFAVDAMTSSTAVRTVYQYWRASVHYRRLEPGLRVYEHWFDHCNQHWNSNDESCQTFEKIIRNCCLASRRPTIWISQTTRIEQK